MLRDNALDTAITGLLEGMATVLQTELSDLTSLPKEFQDYIRTNLYSAFNKLKTHVQSYNISSSVEYRDAQKLAIVSTYYRILSLGDVCRVEGSAILLAKLKQSAIDFVQNVIKHSVTIFVNILLKEVFKGNNLKYLMN